MNPYAIRKMIRDPLTFYGREQQLNDLYNRLAATQSCSIVGPRRIGKSSLLYHLAHPFVYSHHLPETNLYVFAFLDLQELDQLGPQDFFISVIEKLKAAGEGKLQFDPERDSTLPGFRRFLSRAGDKNLRLVLCLDEFERLAGNPNFTPDFFSFLRGLCSNYSLALVTSSQTSLYDLCHKGELKTSQFWNIFTELPLGLMPSQEAIRLIQQPSAAQGRPINDDLARWLLDLTAGHPLFIQIACYHLYEAMAGGAPPNLQLVEENYLSEARVHYAYTWDHLTERLKETVSMLSRQAERPADDPSSRELQRYGMLPLQPEGPIRLGRGWQRYLAGLGIGSVTVLPTTTARPQETAQPDKQAQPIPQPSGMQYQDFDLLFEKREDGYQARLLESPAGTAVQVFSLPFTPLEFENIVLRLGMERRGVRRELRSGDPMDMNAARDIGSRLFNAVFQGTVGNRLYASLDEIDSKKGVRIRLRLGDVPDLMDAPWEYLYNSDLKRFYSLSISTPIVRYLDLPERIRALPVRPPLNILVMICDLPEVPLDVELEFNRLDKALAGLKQQGRVQLDRLAEPTLSDLREKLLEKEYHIFHFIGHGMYDANAREGVLVMRDQNGNREYVNGERLGRLLHDERTLRLVLLNACEGGRSSTNDPFAGVAQSLMQQGIPAVVAMQFPITDVAAIALSQAFYASLAVGDPIDAALTEARRAIDAKFNGVEWGTPVLYMRAEDGRIFDLQ